MYVCMYECELTEAWEKLLFLKNTQVLIHNGVVLKGFNTCSTGRCTTGWSSIGRGSTAIRTRTHGAWGGWPSARARVQQQDVQHVARRGVAVALVTVPWRSHLLEARRQSCQVHKFRFKTLIGLLVRPVFSSLILSEAIQAKGWPSPYTVKRNK